MQQCHNDDKTMKNKEPGGGVKQKKSRNWKREKI